MLPTIRPGPARRWHVPLVTAIALATAIAGSSAAQALDVALGPPHVQDGYVWTDVTVKAPFAARVEESLSRGMPATLDLHAELWRRRAGWFDRLVNSVDASVKIRYEVWSHRYKIERRGAPDRVVANLDSVRALLSGPLMLPVARVEQVKPGSRYYLVLSVTMKPLSVEDVEEGEGWLSGEVASKRRAGVGLITAIPRSLFDAVRNFTGFGDQRARAISRDFGIESLYVR